MTKNPDAVRLGRKGGKAKSPAKKRSGKLNMAKARASRWPKDPRCLCSERYVNVDCHIHGEQK